jgi:hypothetical protein
MGKRHGMTGTPEHDCWLQARARCNNPHHASFHDYGGRGIEFRFESFEAFYAHLGPRPRGYTLERVDNDGHYELGNVRWATREDQQNNRRANQYITFKGKTLNITQWAQELGVSRSTLYNRIARGWCDDRVVSEPIADRGRRMMRKHI